MSMTPKVAFSQEFFKSFASLPKTQQGKTVKFMELFRQTPKSPGINYENLRAIKDKTLRSVRIDQAYRAIVSAPQKGNAYILLWVGKHDDAYEWAKSTVLKINSESGALQFLNSEYINEAHQLKSTSDGSDRGLFSTIRDRYLIRLGVPDDLIPLVRQVVMPLDVDELKKKIPDEAYDALSLLADGDTLEEVLSAYDIQLHENEEQEIDTEDFSSALDRPNSKRHFVLSSDDKAVQNMLDAPLETWRVFLHPLQGELINRNWNGPVRVLGGAGTGKTVVAMHRAKWLAEQTLAKRDKKILFTTFTKNLATDIENNLKTICSTEEMDKIEVINLDAWVQQFLESQGEKQSSLLNIESQKRIWRDVLSSNYNKLDPPVSFCHEEWNKIIQPNNVESLENYLKVSRIGRGVKLNRTKRKIIWPIFHAYRQQLLKENLKESDDLYREAMSIITSKNIRLPYDSIIIDEAQDISMNAFKLIRSIVPEDQNDLFIVGDTHQRIYDNNTVILSHCGINIKGRSKKLKLNYRTSKQIHSTATTILEGIDFDNLDNGIDEQKGYTSLIEGEEPTIKCFKNAQMEENDLIAWFRDLSPEGLTKSCLTVRRQKDIERYTKALESANIPYLTIDHNSSDETKHEGIRVISMHRVKGLEFDNMYIASVNDDILPLIDSLDTQDGTITKKHEHRERSLLYVAITRAKKTCHITGFGKLSTFIEKINT